MKHVTFYYVRHGRTEFNRDGIVQGGSVDSPLAAESLHEVEATAHALADVPFARCYSSPLGRACETARIVVGERNLAIQPLNDLREFNFGKLDGKPGAQVVRQFGICFVLQDFSRYGGEKGSEVRTRVRRAFTHMFNESHDGDNVLVVAHGALFRYVLLEFYPAPYLRRRFMSETVRTPNGGIAVVEGTGLGASEVKLRQGESLAGAPAAGAALLRPAASMLHPSFKLVALPVSGDRFRLGIRPNKNDSLRNDDF